MRFRRRPMEVEAEQFLLTEPFPDGVKCSILSDGDTLYWLDKPFEGGMPLNPGDWVVTLENGDQVIGKKGHFELHFERHFEPIT